MSPRFITLRGVGKLVCEALFFGDVGQFDSMKNLNPKVDVLSVLHSKPIYDCIQCIHNTIGPYIYIL